MKPESQSAQTGRRTARCFGPVADLEAHLPDSWWNEIFNSLYLKTDGDVVENDVNTLRDVSMVIAAGRLGPTDQIVDLCCGQGRHCIELAKQGYKGVIGIDRSRYLVRLARRRAREQGLSVSFREGDARSVKLPDMSADCVIIMGNSFGYFSSEDEDLKVLGKAAAILKRGGRLVIDVTDGDWIRENFEARTWEWIDQHHFVCRERSLSADGTRLISREVIIHDEKGVIADQFYAERLYSKLMLAELLDSLDFVKTHVFDDIGVASDRNQDLGMMERRFLMVSQSSGEYQRGHPSRRKAIKNVGVLLGDPRLPDSVKVDGVFNPEDMETVRQLKSNLERLKDYKFKYFDDHSTLLDDLKTAPPDMVLNLCDEGFGNDAFQELHIPAYLEMLNIPYTGAGPACLAACYDKGLVRAIAESQGIAVPTEIYISADDLSSSLPSIFPAMLKPNYGDNSIGITQRAVVRSQEELIASLEEIHALLPNTPILVQEFLEGDEFSVAILGNPGNGMTALPILQVDYSKLPPQLPRILGYESKWLPDSPYWTQIHFRAAELSGEDRAYLVGASTKLFERLGCRDYARFDFRADHEGNMKLLEVNPNPGWSVDGKMNLMAEFAGLSYADLFKEVLDAAIGRGAAVSQGNGLRLVS